METGQAQKSERADAALAEGVELLPHRLRQTSAGGRSSLGEEAMGVPRITTTATFDTIETVERDS
jgi:hypothetical protein